MTTENFGAAPGQDGLAAYAIDERTGTLAPLGETERNGQSDTCWVAITDDNRFAFTSSFGDDGGVSSYRVGPDGSLELLNPQAATVGSGSSDVALRGQPLPVRQEHPSGDGHDVQIERDGALTQLDSVRDNSPGAGSIGLAAR